MRIYATRRECEIILNSMYSVMQKLKIEEMPEYNEITNRILKVTANQCKNDRTHFEEVKNG